MNLYAHARKWLLATGCLWVLVSAAAGAPAHPGAVVAVRAWTPPVGRDDLDSARAALQPDAHVALPPGDRPEFRAEARQPIWYALDLEPGPEGLPRVLELTHPSLRAADLYLPGKDGPSVVLRGGRDIPMAQRSGARFPATFALPPDTPPGTAYLRLKSTVPTRGLFLLQPRDDWKSQSRWQFWAMTGCFAVVVCAVAYAMTRAWRLRSRAYGLYALLGLCIGMAGMFISGYGESWIWPAWPTGADPFRPAWPASRPVWPCCWLNAPSRWRFGRRAFRGCFASWGCCVRWPGCWAWRSVCRCTSRSRT